MSRVIAIRHRAWFAWRFPPWLRRCRTVLPDDASIGDSAAEGGERGVAGEAFGVVAGHDQQDRCDVAADTERSAQRRVHDLREPVELTADRLDIGGERLVLACQGPQGCLGCFGRINGVAGAEPGASLDTRRVVEVLEGRDEVLQARTHNQCVDLVDHLGAGVAARRQHDPEHTRIDSTTPSWRLG